MANNFADYAEQKIADLLFGNVAWTIPGSYYVALSTTIINDDGTGMTEPAGGGYARKQIANNKTTFSNAAASGGGYEVHNLIDIIFNAPTGDQGTITYVALMDAAAAGNMIAYAPLNTSMPVNTSTGPAAFFANSLSFILL